MEWGFKPCYAGRDVLRTQHLERTVRMQNTSQLKSSH